MDDLTEGLNALSIKSVIPQQESEASSPHVRSSCQHVGRTICGKDMGELWGDPPEDKIMYACAMDSGHEGDCYSLAVTMDQTQKDDFDASGYFGGCDTFTILDTQIAVMFAIDPEFQDSVYCIECSKRAHVGEFVWAGTKDTVGS